MENKKDLSKLTTDQLKALARVYVPQLEKTNTDAADNANLSELSQSDDEVMSFILANKIMPGETKYPKDLIFYEYKKNKKPLQGLNFQEFFKKFMKHFKYQRSHKYEGKYTHMYYLNWPNYTYTLDYYRTALRFCNEMRMKEMRLREKKKKQQEIKKQEKIAKKVQKIDPGQPES